MYCTEIIHKHFTLWGFFILHFEAISLYTLRECAAREGAAHNQFNTPHQKHPNRGIISLATYNAWLRNGEYYSSKCGLIAYKRKCERADYPPFGRVIPCRGGFKAPENKPTCGGLYFLCLSVHWNTFRSRQCIKKPAQCAGFQGFWRRERDSNPRYSSPYTHFPGVLLQPLGHLS